MEVGIKKRQSKLEKRLNKWVALTVIGNGTQLGYLKEVDGREITLNPYRGWRYNKEYGFNLYEIVHDDCDIEISPNGYVLEKTNRETIDYSIKELNENIIKEKEKKDSEEKNN